MKLSKRILYTTLVSIALFFSISFVTVLLQLNSPINRQLDYTLEIGFPFIYYNQFFIEPPIPNSGWNVNNLILDYSLVWLVVFAIYSWIFKNKKNG